MIKAIHRANDSTTFLIHYRNNPVPDSNAQGAWNGKYKYIDENAKLIRTQNNIEKVEVIERDNMGNAHITILQPFDVEILAETLKEIKTQTTEPIHESEIESY